MAAKARRGKKKPVERTERPTFAIVCVADEFIARLTHEDVNVRIDAAFRLYGLGIVGITRLLQALKETSDSEYRPVVMRALGAIGVNYPLTVIPALREAVTAHDDEPHRQAYRDALAWLMPALFAQVGLKPPVIQPGAQALDQ